MMDPVPMDIAAHKCFDVTDVEDWMWAIARNRPGYYTIKVPIQTTEHTIVAAPRRGVKWKAVRFTKDEFSSLRKVIGNQLAGNETERVYRRIVFQKACLLWSRGTEDDITMLAVGPWAVAQLITQEAKHTIMSSWWLAAAKIWCNRAPHDKRRVRLIRDGNATGEPDVDPDDEDAGSWFTNGAWHSFWHGDDDQDGNPPNPGDVPTTALDRPDQEFEGAGPTPMPASTRLAHTGRGASVGYAAAEQTSEAQQSSAACVPIGDDDIFPDMGLFDWNCDLATSGLKIPGHPKQVFRGCGVNFATMRYPTYYTTWDTRAEPTEFGCLPFWPSEFGSPENPACGLRDEFPKGEDDVETTAKYYLRNLLVKGMLTVNDAARAECLANGHKSFAGQEYGDARDRHNSYAATWERLADKDEWKEHHIISVGQRALNNRKNAVLARLQATDPFATEAEAMNVPQVLAEMMAPADGDDDEDDDDRPSLVQDSDDEFEPDPMLPTPPPTPPPTILTPGMKKNKLGFTTPGQEYLNTNPLGSAGDDAWIRASMQGRVIHGKAGIAVVGQSLEDLGIKKVCGVISLPVSVEPNVYAQEYLNAKLAKEERLDKKGRKFNATKLDKEKLAGFVAKAISSENPHAPFSSKKILEELYTMVHEQIKSGKWTSTRLFNAISNICRTIDPTYKMSASVKLEAMPEGKAPRLLIADGDEGQVMALLTIACMERLIKKHFPCKGIKGLGKREAIRRVMLSTRCGTKMADKKGKDGQRRGVSVFEGDGSAWDTTCSEALRRIVENPVIYHIAKHVNAFLHSVPESWAQAHYKACDLSELNLSYSKNKELHKMVIAAIRRSGHRGTSCCNWWVNFTCWHCSIFEKPWAFLNPALRQSVDVTKTLRWFASAYEGDDSWLNTSPAIKGPEGNDFGVRSVRELLAQGMLMPPADWLKLSVEAQDSLVAEFSREDGQPKGDALYEHFIMFWARIGFNMDVLLRKQFGLFAGYRMAIDEYGPMIGVDGPGSEDVAYMVPEIDRCFGRSGVSCSPEMVDQWLQAETAPKDSNKEKRCIENVHRLQATAAMSRAHEFAGLCPTISAKYLEYMEHLGSATSSGYDTSANDGVNRAGDEFIFTHDFNMRVGIEADRDAHLRDPDHAAAELRARVGSSKGKAKADAEFSHRQLFKSLVEDVKIKNGIVADDFELKLLELCGYGVTEEERDGFVHHMWDKSTLHEYGSFLASLPKSWRPSGVNPRRQPWE